MAGAQSSLLADTNHDILSTIDRMETSGDIKSPYVANLFRDAVRANAGSILSLYLLDVERSDTTGGKYRVMVFKELTLMKDFVYVLGAALSTPPPRELTIEEVALRFKRDQRDEDKTNEQHSEGYR